MASHNGPRTYTRQKGSPVAAAASGSAVGPLITSVGSLFPPTENNEEFILPFDDDEPMASDEEPESVQITPSVIDPAVLAVDPNKNKDVVLPMLAKVKSEPMEVDSATTKAKGDGTVPIAEIKLEPDDDDDIQEVANPAKKQKTEDETQYEMPNLQFHQFRESILDNLTVPCFHKRKCKYKCQKCNVVLKQEHLEYHMQYHLGWRTDGYFGLQELVCLYCNTTFASRPEFANHQKHVDPSAFGCWLCKDIFKTRDLLTEHVCSLHRDLFVPTGGQFRMLTCIDCNITLLTVEEFDAHMFEKHIRCHLVFYGNDRFRTVPFCGDRKMDKGNAELQKLLPFFICLDENDPDDPQANANPARDLLSDRGLLDKTTEEEIDDPTATSNPSTTVADPSTTTATADKPVYAKLVHCNSGQQLMMQNQNYGQLLLLSGSDKAAPTVMLANPKTTAPVNNITPKIVSTTSLNSTPSTSTAKNAPEATITRPPRETPPVPKTVRVATFEEPTGIEIRCEYCKVAFSKPEHVALHQKTAITGYYPCSVCGESFRTMLETKNHTMSHFTSGKQLKCLSCSKSLLTDTDFADHMVNHHMFFHTIHINEKFFVVYKFCDAKKVSKNQTDGGSGNKPVGRPVVVVPDPIITPALKTNAKNKINDVPVTTVAAKVNDVIPAAAAIESTEVKEEPMEIATTTNLTKKTPKGKTTGSSRLKEPIVLLDKLDVSSYDME